MSSSLVPSPDSRCMKHLPEECAEARSAVAHAAKRHWWEIYAIAHPETGRLVHTRFLSGGAIQYHGPAYIYNADTKELAQCDPALHFLDALRLARG
jgi:hypothetical protein